MSAGHFVKLQRSEIVVPAKFGDGTGFLVLSHWFVVLSFDFLFDFSMWIWYNGFGKLVGINCPTNRNIFLSKTHRRI